MKKAKKLELLENTVTENGYKLRYEKGNFLGGDCRLKEDNIIVVNKFLPIEGKIFTIARVLHKLNPADCSPEVKKIIEDSGFSTGNQLPLIENAE
ncbi:MAG: hypothetical protein ISR54_05550 [Chlorobium phaeobacteroides]|uniref:Uncharacterized protein n=1 Tax=Chlorobium phaeobacteroides (strain BS1) TaxID=331678 RepID=B3EPZ2_CHLPB|nr:hypothetical protein [Chlorobium phaeobacteroides]MBL6956269.1 hypothetical protein [Chlorobium phaeobacteroides]